MLPITQVVVHRDGAIVHRAGPARVTDGQAIVAGLPLSLDTTTLRVRAEGAEVRSVQVQLDVEGFERAEPVAAERALRDAKQRLRAAEVRLSALQVHHEAIAAQVPALPSKNHRPSPTPAALRSWSAVEPALAEWTQDVQAKTRALHEEIRLARQQVEAATWSLTQLADGHRLAAWLPRWVLRIGLEGLPAESAEITLHLSYRVTAARWTPTYALMVDGAFRRGKLQFRALVAQDTGEDWTGVQVSVSASACQRRVELPELPSLRLGSASAPKPSPWRDLPDDLDALFPADLPAPPPPARARRAPAPPPPPAPIDLESGADEEAFAFEAADAAPAPKMAPRPMMAPAAASRSAAMPAPKGPAGFGGGPPRGGPPGGGGPPAAFAPPAPQPPPELPGPLQVQEDLLDYPRLRLAGWDAPAGARGRLRPLGLEALAQEAGLPEAGAQRLVDVWASVEGRASKLQRLPLPPHTPTEGAAEGAWHTTALPDPVNIPADGAWHQLVGAEEDLSIELRYRAIPKLDPRAFRRVLAKRTQVAPLLPGPLEVLVDGVLQRTVPWGGAARGNALRLELGAEDHLRVARNVSHSEESVGLFGGERRLHTRIRTEVASALAREAVVELIEPVPVSGEDNVTIVVAGADPAAEAWTGEAEQSPVSGARLQVLTVKAGGQAQATLHYHVTLGAKRELVGGDRRG